MDPAEDNTQPTSPDEIKAPILENAGSVSRAINSKFRWLLIGGGMLFMWLVLAAVWPYLNFNPPAYIKQLTAYKEGSDGIVVYVALADKNGALTTASGKLSVTIEESYTDKNWLGQLKEYDRTLFRHTVEVNRFAFQNTEIGVGAFSRKMLIYPFGRIPYSRFNSKPSKPNGKVKVVFTPDSGDLPPIQSEETTLF